MIPLTPFFALLTLIPQQQDDRYFLGGTRTLRGFEFSGAGQQPSEQQPEASRRGFLGVSTQYSEGGGVEIVEVVANSPAARARLRAGDRLTRIAGEEIDTYANLVEALKQHAPGASVEVGFERELRVQLDDEHKDGERFLLGVFLADIEEQDDSPARVGVTVTRLSSGYPAAGAGVAAGDVLLGVAGKPVDASQAVIAALADVGEPREVTLRIARTRSVVLGANANEPSAFGLGRSELALPRFWNVPTPAPNQQALEEELRALTQELRELREQVARLRGEIDRLRDR